MREAQTSSTTSSLQHSHRHFLRTPVGCDTFVAFPPDTPDGTVIFGKNSDRPAGEGQSIRRYPGVDLSAGGQDDNGHQSQELQCTYLSIPQAPRTYEVLLSQIDWMWGAEMGANEWGVVIGNEAVWTRVPDDDDSPALLGMDLVRLGLERGSSAEESLNVITSLLQKYGQGGACAENDPSFTYHNSFLIADASEAWVLETAAKHWVAKRTVEGSVNISNNLTIRQDFDRSSDGLQEYAIKSKLWSGRGDFDWAKIFSDGGISDLTEASCSRQVCGQKLLASHSGKGTLTPKLMIEILRDHESGVCMHGGFETTSSMVSELARSNPRQSKHWMTGKPHPCKSEFLLQDALKESL